MRDCQNSLNIELATSTRQGGGGEWGVGQGDGRMTLEGGGSIGALKLNS